ncbi:MAG: hypothetical protein GZ088_08250 [Acidipila sp.]|nr:hypothetical protein [Acidipila sp.]
MKRKMLGICGVVIIATVVYAGDVWRDKPYKAWTQKDVQKILSDSPWVKTAHVSASWRTGDRSHVPYDTAGTANQAGGADVGTYSTGPGGPTSANSGSMAQNAAILASAKNEANFVVSWFSAHTVQQALARGQVLSGAMTETDADKALVAEFEEYAITVSGRDMMPFFKATENDLVGNSSLLLKEDKKKIPATRVTFQRPVIATPNILPPITAVIFYFPKKNPSGDPVISPAEKSAEFLCSYQGVNIKASFDLQKMVAAQGADW